MWPEDESARGVRRRADSKLAGACFSRHHKPSRPTAHSSTVIGHGHRNVGPSQANKERTPKAVTMDHRGCIAGRDVANHGLPCAHSLAHLPRGPWHIDADKLDSLREQIRELPTSIEGVGRHDGYVPCMASEVRRFDHHRRTETTLDVVCHEEQRPSGLALAGIPHLSNASGYGRRDSVPMVHVRMDRALRLSVVYAQYWLFRAVRRVYGHKSSRRPKPSGARKGGIAFKGWVRRRPDSQSSLTFGGRSQTLTSKPPSVAVLLNVYRRGEHFRRQVESAQGQSIRPSSIFVWQNEDHFQLPDDLVDQLTLARCNRNLGVWARLAFALNIDSDFICMLDDDTIPGREWLRNCVDTMRTNEGLLGARGLRFKSRRSYFHHDEFGWAHPNSTVEQVDIVGHSWFFRREWLSAFWAELPAPCVSRTVGEDIHFSYALQKYLGLGTFVPPHPAGREDLWGSQPEVATVLGVTGAGVSTQPGAQERFQRVFVEYMNRDFQLCTETAPRDDLVAVGSNLARRREVKWVLERAPFLKKIKRSLKDSLGGR